MKFLYISLSLFVASVSGQCIEEDGVLVTSSTFPGASGFYSSLGNQDYINTEGEGAIIVDRDSNRWVWFYGDSFCFTTSIPFGNPGTGGVNLGNNGPDKKCTTYDVEFSCPSVSNDSSEPDDSDLDKDSEPDDLDLDNDSEPDDLDLDNDSEPDSDNDSSQSSVSSGSRGIPSVIGIFVVIVSLVFMG